MVGKGGFGKVNAVEHRLTGQLYALKTIEKALLLSMTAPPLSYDGQFFEFSALLCGCRE